MASSELLNLHKMMLKLRDGVGEMPVLGLGLYLLEPGAETEQTVLSALDLGYRHLDGAAFYNNEASVGQALRKSAVPRSEVWYTTKVWTTDRTHDEAVRSIERSVAETGGAVDLALVHWPVPGAHVEMYRGLVTCQKRGLCRFIGLSNYMPTDYAELEESGLTEEVAPVVNQIEVSPNIYRKAEIEFFQKRGIVVQAFKPLGRGALLEQAPFLELGIKYNTTASAVLLKWAKQKGFSVLCKSRSSTRLAANKHAVDGNDFLLSDADMLVLDGATTEEARDDARRHYEKRRAGTTAPWGDGPRPALSKEV